MNQVRPEMIAPQPLLRRGAQRDLSTPSRPAVAPGGLDERIVDAIGGARDFLMQSQSSSGHWEGALDCGVSASAWTLLLYERLCCGDREAKRKLANYIRFRQGNDGGWSAGVPGDPSDLSVSIEAYWALKLAGDKPDQTHMRKAVQRIWTLGDPNEIRPLTKLVLAIFGEFSWDSLACVPPELIVLGMGRDEEGGERPAPAALGLSILSGKQVGFKLPPWASLREVFQDSDSHRGQRHSVTNLRAFLAKRPAEHLWGAMERSPFKPFRSRAIGAAARQLREIQSPTGGWHDFTNTWFALLGLHSHGMGNDDPVMDRGLRYIESLQTRLDSLDAQWQQIQSTLHADTVGAALALARSSRPGDVEQTAAVDASIEALLDRRRADSAHATTLSNRARAIWGWSSASSDVDLETTARVVELMALRADRRLVGSSAERSSIQRALTALLGAQRDDGSWPRFETSEKPATRVDPSLGSGPWSRSAGWEDTTAHAIEAICAAGSPHSEPVQRGVRYLLSRQTNDGGWIGRWSGAISCTALVVRALHAAGVAVNSEPMRRARYFLIGAQTQSGAWGESPAESIQRGRLVDGVEDAIHTAQALQALALIDDAQSVPLRRGLNWLLENQHPAGFWPLHGGSRVAFDPMVATAHHLDAVIEPLLALNSLRTRRSRL